MAYTTIDDPELYFQCKIWTGDGGTQAITLDGDENMQPDFVWCKARDSLGGITGAHFLYDAVRGAGAEKELLSNATNLEGANANEVYGYISSFDSNGFTTTAGSSNNEYFNKSSINYVAWCWRTQGGAGSSNTDGSINTTTTSVGTTQGFSISTYTGNDTAGATIGHGLGAVPGLIIIKCRDASQSWVVYHHKNTAAPETDFLILNDTDATADHVNRWNDTAPTSTLITLGDENQSNGSQTYVAYAFTGKQGYSKFGSYTGNGDADGTFVYTGFRPAFILGKNTTDAGNHWFIIDAARSPYNGDSKWLKADDTSAELTNLVNPDFFSNGFKIRSSDAIYNTSGSTFIYMAFAEAPLVNSNGVPCNAR